MQKYIINDKTLIRLKISDNFEDNKSFDTKTVKTIEVLNDSILIKIFGFLSIQEKYELSQIGQKWQQLIQRMMSLETVLTFGVNSKDSNRTVGQNKQKYCSNIGHNLENDLSELLERQQKTNRLVFRSLTRLAPLVRMTYNIQCLVFSNCFVDTIALKWIVSQSSRLECLTFDNIDGIQELDWPKLGKPLSSKLIHFCFTGNRMNGWKSLTKMVKYFDVLEELRIIDFNPILEGILRCLKSSLKSLTITNCPQLDVKAIKALSRSKESKIKELTITFCPNANSLEVMDNIYRRIPDLCRFEINNLNKTGIELFLHEIDCKRMTIVFNKSIDLLAFITFSVPIREALMSIQTLVMTGSVNLLVIQSITQLITNCQNLRLIDCQFECECPTDRTETNETKDHLSNNLYKCRKCFKLIIDCILRISQMVCLDINGNEFHK